MRPQVCRRQRPFGKDTGDVTLVVRCGMDAAGWFDDWLYGAGHLTDRLLGNRLADENCRRRAGIVPRRNRRR